MHIMAPVLDELWRHMFGRYEPVMTDVLDANGHVIGQVVAEGTAGVDWAYVGLLVAFIVLLYGTLRIIEAVIRNV